MKESQIQAESLAQIRALGCLATPMESRGMAGWPDVLVLVPPELRKQPAPPEGLHLWLEFKQPGGRVSALQESLHRMLVYNGAQVAVVRSVETAVNFVKTYMEGMECTSSD